jgi:glycosyltransferase involved in cell wall biosynthesis
MRILLINQFFWPDFAATGQFLEDLARHMAQQGHEVTVICGRGVYAGSRHAGDPPPIKILRVCGAPFTRTVAGRGLSYISFLAGALWRGVRTDRADLVLTLTTPPLLSIVGTLLKRLKKSRHYIWEMDLFPDALVSLGALNEHSVFARLLGRIADYSRNQSDGIIALGPCMRERLLKRGVSADKIHIAENWADSGQISPVTHQDRSRLNVLYSGNLGLSHDIETIASAMERLRNDPRFHFSFIGGGARRSELETFCRTRGLCNVTFLPYSSRDQVGNSLASGDVGLVTMKDGCLGTVVPSKLYGLMAAQRPVLFIGPGSATPALVIKEHDCGWQVDCGDTQGLINLLEKLFQDRRLIRDAGARARQVFIQNYDLIHGIARISTILRLTRVPDSTREDKQGSEALQLPLKGFEVLR